MGVGVVRAEPQRRLEVSHGFAAPLRHLPERHAQVVLGIGVIRFDAQRGFELRDRLGGAALPGRASRRGCNAVRPNPGRGRGPPPGWRALRRSRVSGGERFGIRQWPRRGGRSGPGYCPGCCAEWANPGSRRKAARYSAMASSRRFGTRESALPKSLCARTESGFNRTACCRCADGVRQTVGLLEQVDAEIVLGQVVALGHFERVPEERPAVPPVARLRPRRRSHASSAAPARAPAGTRKRGHARSAASLAPHAAITNRPTMGTYM
jgi:hypothetical protein